MIAKARPKRLEGFNEQQITHYRSLSSILAESHSNLKGTHYPKKMIYHRAEVPFLFCLGSRGFCPLGEASRKESSNPSEHHMTSQA